MKILTLEQGSSEWLEWRRSKITSTDAATLLGKNPYRKACEVWQEKTGHGIPFKETAAMKLGKEREPIARALFIKNSGINMTPVVVEHEEYSWCAASLDGISNDGKSILEIKCPGKASHDLDKLGSVKPYYYAQMQHQLLVTGADEAYYMSYRPEDQEPCIFMIIEADKEYQETMFHVEQDFWDKLQLELVGV